MKKIIIRIIITVILIPVVLVAISNIVMFLGDMERGTKIEQNIDLMGRDSIKGITLIWLALAAVLVFVFPSFIRFVFKRVKCYSSLFAVCSKEGYKFKLKRFPLASFFGVKAKEDVCITRGGEKYFIHFIDVIGRARVFTLIDGRTYNVSKTAANGATITPLFDMSFSSAKRVILDGSKNTIPEFDKNDGKHIIIVDPLPMEVRYIENNVPKPLFSGYSIGNITYYEAEDFIKFLKRI
ncbi:MAG: hypothetical protein E7633_04790 [Ruminococcaceae bacterium]|nr:hypothetical protein [Oscillospiraceae bacterium]